MYIYLLIIATIIKTDIDEMELDQPLGVYKTEALCKKDGYHVAKHIEIENYNKLKCIKVKVIE